MPEEEQTGKESELPLFADFDRFANLLTEAQILAKKNSNYNAATFRDYFVILGEISRFLYPMFNQNERMKGIIEDVKALDQITLVAYQKVLTIKSYKIPSTIFYALSDLHTDLLVLKQEANLGIKVKSKISERQSLENVLE